jgi:nucleotide-binding universal stress UspA family protein
MASSPRAAAAGEASGKPRQASGFKRILLASEGRAFSDAVIAQAERLISATPGARIHVFSVARVYGTSLGMPNPGLLPTKREWEGQEQSVTAAAQRFRRKGIRASGRVLGTRKAMQRICQEAEKEGCDAIVMGADRDRSPLIAGLMWSQEPQRVSRRAKVPVFLVTED